MTYYIGLISGTSADDIDAALVSIEEGQCELIATHQHPYPAQIRERILSLYEFDGSDQIETMGELDTQLGELFANAALTLLANPKASGLPIAAIGSHGQTLRHRPRTDSGLHYTLQIADASIIAARTGITTVSDFRRKDMAHGGQGAPLAPGFHQAVMHNANENRAVVNLGGIANITYLPKSGDVIGFDTGPANGLMDAWSQLKRDRPCDEDGAWAASGSVNATLLNTLKAHPYFKLRAPKSTGREEFSLGWLTEQLTAFKDVLEEDVQATLAVFSAQTLAEALLQTAGDNGIDQVFLCGGGVHNKHLVQLIQQTLPDCHVESTAAIGVAPDWVEATAFAWFAKQTLDGLPSNIPSVTGAKKACVLGAIYPP